MNQKITCFYVCLLLVMTILPLTAMGGSENDPEIIDGLNDQFGALVDHPERLRTRVALFLLQVDSFDFIDIDSAWFFENALEPDYLYATLKLSDLYSTAHRAIYSIHFTYDRVEYAVGSHLCQFAQNASGFVGLDKRITFNLKDVETTYDFDDNLVTFKLEKSLIGDPQPGDIITRTFAWTALRFHCEPFSLLFSNGELVKDAAPFRENMTYGLDYQILY